MRVITLLNEKGGTGKTTVSTHLAAALAILGNRVILVDSDAQGHSTVAFGLEKEPAFYDYIVRNAKLADVVRLVNPEQYALPDRCDGHLMIIPGNVETRSIASNISDAFAVLRRVIQLRDIADYVIFDTSPTPSLLHASIYMATDSIIYPTKCEAWSFDGLRESLSHLEGFQPVRERHNLPPIKLAGVVPVMVRPQTVEHSENLDFLRREFPGNVWQALQNRIIWAECTSHQKSIFALAPESAAAAEFWKIVEKVEEHYAIKT